MTAVRVFLAGALALAVIGCNTVEGAKKDAQQAGEAVEKGVRKAGQATGRAVERTGAAIERTFDR